MTKVIQIGVGHWGVNHKRILTELGVLEATCDFNGKETFKTLDGIPTNVEADHAVVCTPPDTHYELVKMLLEKEKHVFVEKPLAETSEQCR